MSSRLHRLLRALPVRPALIVTLVILSALIAAVALVTAPADDGLRVAYLFPADGTPQNVWIVDPHQPDTPRQVTFSTRGIFDFAISPDGTRIAYSEPRPDSDRHDLHLIDLRTHALRQITNCQDADCTGPAWHPDGRTLAYERIDTPADAAGHEHTTPRIWLIDLTVSPATTRLLLDDTHRFGYGPHWSADGARLAFTDPTLNATVVYDLAAERILFLANQSGAIGALSPDGRRLAVSDLILFDDDAAVSQMRVIDLDSEAVTLITDQADRLLDQRAQWSPDGLTLAVARQDESVVRGTQIALVDPLTGESRLLTDDPRYANAFFWYDPTGTQMLVQRFPELGEDMQPDPLARPEIWIFDLATGTGTLLARNGFLPRWVP